MADTQWLLDNGSVPMQYCLLKKHGDRKYSDLVPELLACPEVQYWTGYLRDYENANQIPKIHGSHDYRFENIVGKLAQLGMDTEIEKFRTLMERYLSSLEWNISQPREPALSFSKIYSYYDFELIIAAMLAHSGFIAHPAIKYVAEKRLNLLYEFAKQNRYDIYVDGSSYPGVKREWQNRLIDPGLYETGNIGLPTIHDVVLLGAVYGSETAVQKKLDSIILWHFGEGYADIPQRYGYFYAPGGSYSAKAVCWKLHLPEPMPTGIERGDPALLHYVRLLAPFAAARNTPWYQKAVDALHSYKVRDGVFRFPDEMLTEKRDAYWIFGKHMGMAEDRRKKGWQEVLSTHWIDALGY